VKFLLIFFLLLIVCGCIPDYQSSYDSPIVTKLLIKGNVVIKDIINNHHHSQPYGKNRATHKIKHISSGCFFHEYFPREYCDYDSVMICTMNEQDIIVCEHHGRIITNYNNKKVCSIHDLSS